MPYRFLRKISNGMAEVSTPDGHTIRLPYSGSLPKPGSVVKPEIDRCCNPVGFIGTGSNKKLASSYPQPRRVSSGQSTNLPTTMLIVGILPEPNFDLSFLLTKSYSKISGVHYTVKGTNDYFFVTENVYRLRVFNSVTALPISLPIKFTELDLPRFYIFSRNHSFPSAFIHLPAIPVVEVIEPYPQRDLYVLETNPWDWGRPAQDRYMSYYRQYFPGSDLYYLKQGQPGLQKNKFEPDPAEINYYEIPDFTKPLSTYIFELYNVR
jgi:hypothetical protein